MKHKTVIVMPIVKHALFATAFFMAACLPALASETSCKITGTKTAHFLFIPYQTAVFSLEMHDTTKASCADSAKRLFDINHGAVDRVTYAFRDEARKQKDEGTVIAGNLSIDALIHDRGEIEGDALGAKEASAPDTGSLHPYGTGGSPTESSTTSAL